MMRLTKEETRSGGMNKEELAHPRFQLLLKSQER